jgi:transaldolase
VETPDARSSPLLRMTERTATEYWNDSCGRDELAYAIERGAVGATSNPSIVLDVLRREKEHWTGRIHALHAEDPTLPEGALTWAVVEEMAVGAAGLLAPVFERTGGRKGRLSLQTDPTFYGAPHLIVDQAVRFAGLAPNIAVKIPVTAAGIVAIEEATYRGANINATVSFTVPQAIAVAEAVERGLGRREALGLDVASMTPVCTIMFGRLDDWMRLLVERDSIAIRPDALDRAGVAVFKRAYAIYRERGYRTRLLGGAYRNLLHWTEFVGGDVILTITHAWQVRINGSGLDPVERIDVPVDTDIIDELLARIPDFGRAYAPDGLTPDEFDGFGATARTLRAFIAAYDELIRTVRDVVLPDPDVRR